MTALAKTEQVTENVFRDSEGRAVTTSLAVAERFGKQHKDVLRDIKNIGCSKEFVQRNFAPYSYTCKLNRKRPAYNITRDGFTFLVMGYTGADADAYKEAYITAFNALEEKAKQPAVDLTDPHQLLQHYASKQIEMQKQLEEAAPAIAFHETCKATDDEVGLRVFAKTVSPHVQKTIDALKQKYLYYTTIGTKRALVARQEYINQGIFVEKSVPLGVKDGEERETVQTMVTSKGRRRLFNYLNKEFPELLNRVNAV